MTVKKAAAPEHPKYIDMIKAAISNLKDRKGSSRQAILKYIKANYTVGPNVTSQLKIALNRGCAKNDIVHSKGIGASGSFKLVKKEAAPAKKKKPAAAKALKKPRAKSAARKPKSSPKKKAAAKKPAAKKPVKKSPAKKAAAKKSAAKKSPAKKAASKAKKATPKPKKAGNKKAKK